MKKILHISKFFYPYYGGIEDVARTIVDELKPYYEQKIICFNHEKGTICNINGADVLRIGTCATIASQPISISYYWELKKIIDDFRPDFIHLHLPNPLICFYLCSVNFHGAKLVVHWHADILGQKFFYQLCKPIEKHILKMADKIIATSQMYMDCSLPLCGFADKTVILPNTVNEKKMHFYSGEEEEVAAIRKKYQNKKIVFFVGRHVPYKGIDYLIKASAYFPDDCVVLIGGTGEQTGALKELAKNNSKIKFVGRLSNNEMKYYLHAASVFAFPSIDRREAFGVALAEALYSGLPAVSFNIKGSGTTWVNQDGKTGLVVPCGDVKAFADGVNKILASDELQQQMSANAKQWVCSHFMKDQILPIMDKIYQ